MIHPRSHEAERPDRRVCTAAARHPPSVTTNVTDLYAVTNVIAAVRDVSRQNERSSVPRVQRDRHSTLILFLGGVALFVDMFLHWSRGSGFGGTLAGWQLPITNQAGLVALALVLVELTRIRGVWLTPSSALLGCLLGAATGILVISGLINLHWGYSTGLKFSNYGYGAWIALALAVVLLFGAWMRLSERGA